MYKFSSLGKNQGLAYAKRVGKVIKKFTEQEQVALVAEGFVFPIVEQAYEYMDDAEKIGKKAIQVAVSTTQQSVNAAIKVAKPFFHAVLSEAELTSLQQKFKMLIRYKGVMLDFCYQHIFNGEICKDGGIGGLHHDYQGALQKSGILKLRKIKEFSNGYYKAEIWCERKKEWIPKSFFPDHYTRGDVMQRIGEALNAPEKSYYQGLREVIEGVSSDSMIIKIVIKGTQGITAYPDL